MSLQTGPSWRAVWDINLRFVYVGFLYLVAWGYWSITSKEWWGFGVCAIAAGFVATVYLIKTLILVIEHLWQVWRLRAYGDQGEAPKGDTLAQRDRIHQSGMQD